MMVEHIPMTDHKHKTNNILEAFKLFLKLQQASKGSKETRGEIIGEYPEVLIELYKLIIIDIEEKYGRKKSSNIIRYVNLYPLVALFYDTLSKDFNLKIDQLGDSFSEILSFKGSVTDKLKSYEEQSLSVSIDIKLDYDNYKVMYEQYHRVKDNY